MRPRIIAQPDLRSAAYMGHDLGAGFCLSFAIRTLRADFQSQPPDKQRETLERAMDRIERYPRGWLAKHWRQIYVPKGEW